MNDRHNEDASDADWLASQFGQTGAVPKPDPQKPEPEKPLPPDEVAPLAAPPTLVNPFGAPGDPGAPPPAGAGVAFPPPPYQPPAQQPPYQQPVQQPPVYQPPVVSPPAQPPAAQPPAAEPPAMMPPAASEPPAPAASPFPWALNPGGDADQPPAMTPPVVAPPVVPPAAAPTLPPLVAPAAMPPVVSPPAWTPPPTPPAAPEPFSWQQPAHEPAPLESSFDGGPQLSAEPPPVPMPFETARLAEVAPDAAAAPPFWDPGATQAMDQLEAADQAPTMHLPPAVAGAAAASAATELLGAAPSPDGEPASALDALFGETSFKEYEPGVDATQSPFAATKETSERAPREGMGTAQKVLLFIAIGLLAALALVALYLLGLRIPELFGPAPAIVPSATPSPSPSETVRAIGPVAPGVYAWDELLGSECLDPFESAWAEEFTVVDCATPHPAQMVYRGTFVESDTLSFDFFPGVDALQSQLTLLCSAPGVIDLAAAGQYTDAQITASFPVTEEQWTDGQHDYFCFVNRSSGELLASSVAGPAATTPPVDPAPPAG